MKTYRRKSMKNKTKKNKRRYKLKGGMSPEYVDTPYIRCPKCKERKLICEFQGYVKDDANCICTNCKWSGLSKDAIQDK